MTLLEIDGLEYGAIESEQLSLGRPLLAGREWTSQLDAVLALQRQSGRSRFLVAATVESDDDLRRVVEATRAELLLVVCLAAAPATVAARIGEREPDRWPGKARLIAHARELAEAVPRLGGIDLTIDTDDRLAEEVAGAIHLEMRNGGLIPGRLAG